MKVAVINSVKDRGGAARMATQLTRSLNLSECGVKATMYHAGDSNADDEFVGLHRPGAKHALAVQTRLLGSLRVMDFGVAEAILQMTRDMDVVHLHNLHGYYVNYMRLLHAWRCRPIVWTWHDMWGATGRCGSAGGCARWQSECAPCPDKSLYPAAWIDHSGRERRDKFDVLRKLEALQIVSPSRWLADIAIARGFPAEQVQVIANPVDTGTFYPRDFAEVRARLKLDLIVPVVLFIASNCADERKGYADFVAATMDTGCIAVAVGDKPYDPAHHVRHIGQVNDASSLADWYIASDVMMIPSKADNFPTTVVESLMCGTPVIGYATGGIPEQLTDRWSEVVPQNDRAALRKSLLHLIDNIASYRKARFELAASSAARWSIAAVTRAYIDTYREVAMRTAAKG